MHFFEAEWVVATNSACYVALLNVNEDQDLCLKWLALGLQILIVQPLMGVKGTDCRLEMDGGAKSSILTHSVRRRIFFLTQLSCRL